MPEKYAILIVDDQPEILNALERLLKEEYAVHTTTSGHQALDMLKEHQFALILADQRMPLLTGVEFFTEAIRIQPDAIRILITAYADINASIEAINKGQIFQYISKPWEPEELGLIVRRAIEKYALLKENRDLNRRLKEANAHLRRENVLLRQHMEKQYDFSNIIGESPKMLQVFKLLQKVIDTPTSVLLFGDTGTGKELIARAIHYNSNRKKKMFVAQNCGALPDTLLESELFGHVRGAFTGAVSDRKGLFEMADGGTIFLDEIADTSPALQLRLLRVLQEGEIKPVGSDRTTSVDVRVIAATNKNLEQEVAAGKFREDLYYRLNVFPITLPPLRERAEDIPVLVHHFIKKYAAKIHKKINGITDGAMELFLKAPFPGNIRELENEIERTVTLADDNQPITPDLISARFHAPVVTDSAYPSETGDSIKEAVENLEIRMIRKALKKTKGNILQAAEDLQLSRAGLHKKLARYKIDPHRL
jgi:two-component system response regulator HupR/HoxA